VPNEHLSSYRHNTQRQLEKLKAQEAESYPLLQSHVTLSENDDQSVHLENSSPKSLEAWHQRSQNDEGTTLQLQNYIQSVNDSDLNFLKESSMAGPQAANPMQPSATN